MTPSLPSTLKTHPTRDGLLQGLAAFLIWGLLPLYIHPLRGHIHPIVVMGHRILWSVAMLVIFVSARRGWGKVGRLVRSPRTLGLLTLTTTLLATNWYLFIYASTHDMNIQASLGYFITPLAFAVLGVVFLGERLRIGQAAAFVTAMVGVVLLAWGLGAVPTIGLAIVATWSLYAAIRKRLGIDAIAGLTVETLILAVPAAIGLMWAYAANPAGLAGARPEASWAAYLSLAGLLTTVPLVLFTSAAALLPLNVLGLLQFLGPTLQFLVAVFAFKEPFTHAHAVAFPVIWAGIALYVIESFWNRRSVRQATQRASQPLSTPIASR